MNATVAFVRTFPQTDKTLCSEVVAAWLHARGAMPRTPRRVQIVTRERNGTDGGADIFAAKIGAREIAPADAAEGDVVLVPCADGNRVLGLHIGGGVTVMAGFGKVHIGHFVISRAWRLPA